MTQMRFESPLPSGCRGWRTAHGAVIACRRQVPLVYQCPACGAREQGAMELRRRLADEQARRERRKGKTFGEAPEGVDPFEGFRG